MNTSIDEKLQLEIDNAQQLNVCVMSDLHGNLPDITQQCDLVILCGDQVPLSIQTNSKKTKNWYLNKFKQWAENLPCDKVIFIAGNHDLHFRKDMQWVADNFNKESKVVYLENEKYEYKGKTFYGTPLCHQFGNWAFMKPDEDLRIDFQKIPTKLDILITHDAPYGTSDVLLEDIFHNSGDIHLGCKSLADAIILRDIKYNFHGHLHSSNHQMELLSSTKVYNTSLLTETYQLFYNPLYINI